MPSAIPIRIHKQGNHKNPAIARCLSAWIYAYKQKIAEKETEHEAKEVANDTFLRTMPPLSGLENICDFIACVNFAYRIELISRNDSTHYLAQVKSALAANGLQSKNGHNSFKRP